MQYPSTAEEARDYLAACARYKAGRAARATARSVPSVTTERLWQLLAEPMTASELVAITGFNWRTVRRCLQRRPDWFEILVPGQRGHGGRETVWQRRDG